MIYGFKKKKKKLCNRVRFKSLEILKNQIEENKLQIKMIRLVII